MVVLLLGKRTENPINDVGALFNIDHIADHPQSQDYEPDRTHEERKFVQKLDVSLLTILCFGYFIKNLDQTNISNAYVSGMKEDLAMNADQLNLIDVAWTTGYVIGQLPSQFILTKVRPSIWIPSCELIWTILTFCLSATTTSTQVIVIRFFVGLVESIFYPAAHFLIGSWYKPSELGKRACIFHASSAAAGMFSGYLQAAVYKGLNGTLGKAGWQWLFIMDGLISSPICLAGFFLIPDLPENTRAFYLTPDDTMLARKRMDDIGRAPRRKLGWSILKRVFERWHVWVLTILYIIFINTGPSSSVNPLSLWMKSEGWSVTLIVSLTTSTSCLLKVREAYRTTLLERHPHGPVRCPVGYDGFVLHDVGLPAQQTNHDVCLDILRVPDLTVPRHLDHTNGAEVVLVLHVTGRCPIRSLVHVVGQRNLWKRRGGESGCAGHHERRGVRLQRLAASSDVPCE